MADGSPDFKFNCMVRLPFQFALTAAVVLLALPACASRSSYDEDAHAYMLALGFEPEERVSGPALADDAPLSLRQALLLNNRHHESLSIEGENYVQALIDKQRRVAAFLPTVGIAPSYARRAGDGGGGGGNRGRDVFDFPVIGEINLFNGYRDIASLYVTAATIEQRRAILHNLQSDFLLETSFAFYDVLRLQRSVEALEHTVTLQEERLRDIRTRLDSGLARPLDVSQAQAQAANTRVQQIAAANALRNARSALRLLTAHPMEGRPLVDDFTPPPTAEPLEQWQKLAAAQRHDVLAADKGLQAARHDVDVAFGQYYPSVTLNLEYALSVASSSTENQWNALLRASMPLFSAGRIEADVRTAWSRVRQAYLASMLTRRQVVADVEQAHHDFVSAGEQIIHLGRRVTASEQALKQAEANYDVQLATNLDRLIAQDELLAARLELITQQYTRKVAYLNLLRAAGWLQTEMNVGLPKDVVAR